MILPPCVTLRGTFELTPILVSFNDLLGGFDLQRGMKSSSTKPWRTN